MYELPKSQNVEQCVS